MLSETIANTEQTPLPDMGPPGPGLDVLVMRQRMSLAARSLLEAMGVSIRPVRWADVRGPEVYRLLAPGHPRLTWLDPARTEALLAGLKRDEGARSLPEWADWLLYSWRRGTLVDFDGGIDFGDSGIDASRVLRDLLRYPM